MTTNNTKRSLKAVVISDVHLGTLGSKAEQLHTYLKTVEPEVLVLNGDFIDAWRFSPKYFPTSHLKVIRYLFQMAEKGCKIIYIPGNHDEIARRFAGFDFGRLVVDNKIVLSLDDTTTWIFHGDVFDVVMHHSKWLAKMGSVGFGILIGINRMVNAFLTFFGGKKISLASRIKDFVKGGKGKSITKFEEMIAQLSIRKGYHFVICGHIHRPTKKRIMTSSGVTTYLNSGDWVENMTALEYYNRDWHLKYWSEDKTKIKEDVSVEEIVSESTEEVFLRAFKEILKS